jgi:hypothetical protein
MIVVKPKIVNSIHSSRESLRCTGPRVGTKKRHSVNDAVELTELDPLSTNTTPALLQVSVEICSAGWGEAREFEINP